VEPHVERSRLDHLMRLTFDRGERRSKRLVPGNERLESPLEGGCIQRPLEPDDVRDVVGRARAFETIEKPEPRLREGRRERSRPVHARDRRVCSARLGAGSHALGQARDRGRLEDGAYR
jgi:hypothetical protein